MNNALTCEKLDAINNVPDGIVWLGPTCHPLAGLVMVYERGSGVMTCGCQKCIQPVAEIKVAER